jgi:hypothetical protein
MAYNIVKGKVQFSDSTTGSIESMVDTHSNQTVAGVKTFSNPITASAGIKSNTNITSASGSFGNLTISSSVHHTPLLILDKAEASSSFIEFRKDGTKYAEINTNEFETLFIKTNAVSYPIFFRQAGNTPLKFQSSNVTFQSFPVHVSQSLVVTGSTIASTISASSNISGSAFYGAGTGLTGIAATSLNLGDSTDNSGGNLIVKISGSGGLESTSAGLRVNPSVAAAHTPPANADTFLISDSAASNVPKKITYQNLARAITSSLSTLTTAGNNGDIQIKNGAALQGSSNLNFNTSTNILSVTGKISASVHVSSSNFVGVGSNLTGVSKMAYSSSTANFAILPAHSLLGINSSGSVVTASFGAANTYQPGQTFTFKDIEGSGSTNHIVIKPSGSQKIDGNSVVKIKANYGAVSIASDGASNFYIVSTS